MVSSEDFCRSVKTIILEQFLLCVHEKLYIATCHNEKELINKQLELIIKYRR